MTRQQTLGVGPFVGVRNTLNPYDEADGSVLADALNVYPQDAIVGGGMLQRPGTTNPVDISGIGSYGGMYAHTSLDGTVYNFVVSSTDGVTPQRVYRWPSMGASLTDVTPTGVILSNVGRQYFASLADVVIVNDGFQKPWLMSNLGGTPVTATPIEYETPTNVLSRGTTDTALANAAFWYSRRDNSPANFGTQVQRSANATGTAIGALGTIPANQWGLILVELDTATGNFVFTAAFNGGAGYTSEALAIAALPARTATRWYVGYVTVHAQNAHAWIAGTDGFAGGSTGNHAQITNYYAGEGPPWTCEQQPVIYSGSVFFVLKQVNGTYAQTAIAWSEPNLPDEGYRQADYDNLWELTQTSANPIYALAATNDTLYYFRENSIGAVAGTPGINFQGTATHDVVAGNIGCVNAATIAQFQNVIYFCDQNGRPYRFPIGGVPEPMWQQAYTLYETAQGVVGVNNIAVIEPNLNLYLAVYVAPNTSRFLTVWDAQTGRYQGTWTFDIAGPFYMAVLRDALNVASGSPHLAMMMGGDGSALPLYKLATIFDDIWSDAGVAMPCSVTTGRIGYDAKDDKQYTRARVIAAHAAFVPALTLSGVTSQQTVPSAAGAVRSSPPENPLYRFNWMLNNVSGRDIAMTVSWATPPLVAKQLKMFRIEVDAVNGSEAQVDDH